MLSVIAITRRLVIYRVWRQGENATSRPSRGTPTDDNNTFSVHRVGEIPHSNCVWELWERYSHWDYSCYRLAFTMYWIELNFFVYARSAFAWNELKLPASFIFPQVFATMSIFFAEYAVSIIIESNFLCEFWSTLRHVHVVDCRYNISDRRLAALLHHTLLCGFL